MQFQFVGCGDAFGSGGRFNTCFHVTGEGANFLIDCGASSLVALKRAGIFLNDIRTILITHFHADHFGGLPPFMLDAQFFSKRTAPLTVAGPHGLQDWFERVMETAFPGSPTSRPARCPSANSSAWRSPAPLRRARASCSSCRSATVACRLRPDAIPRRPG